MMAGVKGRDTMPEPVVRRIAHRLGLRFRQYRKTSPAASASSSCAAARRYSCTAVPGIGTMDTDFLGRGRYRINRRRTSSCDVEGLEITRISTWSAVQIVETFVDVSGDGERPPKVTRRPNPGGICRLEFDIDTIPEFDRALDKEVVPKIFDELVDAGNQIAARGDVS